MRDWLLFGVLLALAVLAFFAGQVLAVTDAPPPPYVNAETGEIDLAKVPDRLPAADQNGRRVGWVFVKGDEGSRKFETDLESRVSVHADDGSDVGYLVKASEEAGVYRFMSIEEYDQFSDAERWRTSEIQR